MKTMHRCGDDRSLSVSRVLYCILLRAHDWECAVYCATPSRFTGLTKEVHVASVGCGMVAVVRPWSGMTEKLTWPLAVYSAWAP